VTASRPVPGAAFLDEQARAHGPIAGCRGLFRFTQIRPRLRRQAPAASVSGRS
jgi:hypothetical protein